jgi:nucleoside-diphosphate-sugar epimerase
VKIFITGATGFTGKALVQRLLHDGHAVVGLDYKEGYKTEELRRLGAEIVIGTVTDRDVLRRYMQGVDVVHHLAAAFRELNRPPGYYHEVNVEGTRNVLEVAREADVRKVVYCSTCGVHGNVDHPPAGEDAPIQPADYYQQTKYEAEPIALDYAKRGLKVTIIRPAAIYGPGDPERFYMIFRQVAKGWFPMFGDGRTLYHPLYIDNLVDALVLAMDETRGNGKAYLIADQEYVAINDLVRRTALAMGVPLRIVRFPVWPVVAVGHVVEKACSPFGITPPIFPRRVDWYRQNRAFRIDQAKQDLGYRPAIGLDEGLRRTYEWYRAEGMLRAGPSQYRPAASG